MPNYKVTSNYKGDDGYHDVDEILVLDEAVAAPLVEAGLVVPTDEKVREVEQPQPPLDEAATLPSAQPDQAATFPPQEPNGFPQQPTQAQIDQDMQSIDGSTPQSPQQLN